MPFESYLTINKDVWLEYVASEAHMKYKLLELSLLKLQLKLQTSN